ncbi:hypothetical protein GCM10022419_125800 [Nonomuraea rosea]|uniref:LuxR family transcriptional regulator n=1 Tax=Nonomuraea rosea TaxID=638574 RepID=A0ABP6ZUC9_9ACTN
MRVAILGPLEVEPPAAVGGARLRRLLVRLAVAASKPCTPPDTMAALVEALAGGRVLLVLDNCEHLVEAAARLTEELLGRCPRLHVLATSREPLGILGETLSPVPPLPPEPAVRLLTERAAAIRPAERLRGAPDTTNPEVARVGGLLRERLGPDAWSAAYARGRELERAQAVELAHDRPV